MITPVFFPFTYIKERDARTVAAFFDGCRFLCTTLEAEFSTYARDLIERDVLQPVWPEKEDLKRVLQKVDEFNAFAQLNKDSGSRLKDFLRERPYFKSDTGVARIRTEIMKTTGETAGEPDRDSFLRHLLFLRLAGMVAAEKEEIDARLKSLDVREKRLFSEMRGRGPGVEDAAVSPFPLSGDEPGETAAASFIHAWADFFNQARFSRNGDASVLFVTTSRAAADYLNSVCKNRINILDIKNFKVHESECKNTHEGKRAFGRYVAAAVKKGNPAADQPPEASDGCAVRAQIELDILKGGYIETIFSDFDNGIPVCRINIF